MHSRGVWMAYMKQHKCSLNLKHCLIYCEVKLSDSISFLRSTVRSCPSFIAETVIQVFCIFPVVFMIGVQICANFAPVKFHLILCTTAVIAADVTWAVREEVQQPLNIGSQLFNMVHLAYTLLLVGTALFVAPDDDSPDSHVGCRSKACYYVPLMK